MKPSLQEYYDSLPPDVQEDIEERSAIIWEGMNGILDVDLVFEAQIRKHQKESNRLRGKDGTNN